MTVGAGSDQRRANRLLRWYPKEWRARYGEEFAELLTSEFSEQPASWQRTANVIASGLLARLTRAGLTSHRLPPAEQVRASLASFGWALALFVALGSALWSQLTIGWQWAPPDTVGTTAAMLVMSAVMLGFVALAVLAAAPIVGVVVRQAHRRQAQALLRPSLLLLLASSLLIVGARHFGNGWPGTGGRPWAHQGLVPGGAAAFLWASTLSISSYWVHPSALLRFPPAELAWMCISPLAAVSAVVGSTKIVRRLDMSARLVDYERRIGRAAAWAMAIFLIGSCFWIVDGGPGPRNLFHAGAIDVSGLALMTGLATMALRCLQRARRVELDPAH
jgi:hypothetical protein